jgi:hypothetical protein
VLAASGLPLVPANHGTPRYSASELAHHYLAAVKDKNVIEELPPTTPTYISALALTTS